MNLPKKDKFLFNLEINNYSQNTVDTYENELDEIESFFQDHSELEDFENLDRQHISDLKQYFTKQKELSPSSINRRLSVLKSLLRYLENMGDEIPISPNTIKSLKTKKKNHRPPKMENMKKLLKAPDRYERDPFIKARNRSILETLFSTGCRLSELASINIEDIDDKAIQILGKGSKERTVYLSDQAQKHLIKYLKHRPKNTAPLYCSKQGNRITARTVQKMVKYYREGLELPDDITPHKIRHAFATRLAQQGADTAAIQHLLGHESLETTTNYINTSDQHAKETHEKYFNN